MNDASFRRVYEEVLGKYNTCEAVIIDTRFNGGGWLHDDLATFLDGERYMRFSPRGQENLGGEPVNKWTKESCVLMNEGNYSDAHLFPFVYKTLDIGDLIGMPVPGTGTAVWWEHLMTGNIVFGIPQVGMKAMDGTLVENEELQPDIKLDNPPEEMAQGKDAQLERAVEKMLEDN
jgi:C-terminal processing protease CtpA/Prc